MIYILVLFILFIVLYYFKKEHFTLQTGVKRGFNYVYNPYPSCNNNNNFFPGYYYRSWRNSNVCPQKTLFNQLTKFKIPLQL